MAKTNAQTKITKDDERRIAPRENLDPIKIKGLMSMDHRTLLSRDGAIVNASKTGFRLLVERKNLIPPEFRDALSLAELEGDQVVLTIVPMDLEISGKITRTKRVNKEVYEVCVDYSEDAPEYWREALMDMLPRASDYKD